MRYVTSGSNVWYNMLTSLPASLLQSTPILNFWSDCDGIAFWGFSIISHRSYFDHNLISSLPDTLLSNTTMLVRMFETVIVVFVLRC